MAGMNNQGNGSMDSLATFLETVNSIAAEELKQADALAKQKIADEKFLSGLRKSEQKEFWEAYKKNAFKIVEEENKNRLNKLKSNQKQQNKDAKKRSDEEFKAKYGFEKKLLAEKQKLELDEENKLSQHRLKLKEKELKEEAKEREKQRDKEARNNAFGAGKSISDRLKGFHDMSHTEDGAFSGKKLFANLTNALGDFAKQLDGKIDEIAKYKGAIDTRLQGSKHSQNWAGSYWEDISTKITGAAGVSPLVKQSDVTARVASMVSQGIAFNVEQRATLDVLKDKIATTFDAANGTLLRLVRIQQQDTTAGRLGMESALTAFLNNMYETTEYMKTISEGVKTNLEEAMSLMTGESAVGFEYQVQKWLGSMYSVGMSQNAVTGLSGVLGKLAAGQIDAITGGGQGNLLVMAANQAGLSVSDLLNNGLTANTTNQLMNSMVDYLAKIYEEAGDSKVIQQQMASVYGMTAADLKAAVNLAKSAGIVARDGLTYSSAMQRLNKMANSMYARTSIGEMMTNMWDNTQYSMAAGIANNPALYALYKAAGLLDNVAGGVEFSVPLVMGSGSAQTFNVANIMRTAALAGGIFSSIGAMIAGGGGGGFSGSGILKAMGVSNGISTVSRGSGTDLVTAGGATVSESGSLVGNQSDSDVQSKTMTDTTDSAKSSTASAVDESEETKLKDIRSDVLDIYHLLQGFTDGRYTMPVEVKACEPTIKVDSSGGSGGY